MIPPTLTEMNAARDLRTVQSNPNHWYPLALSKDLRDNHTLSVQFGGIPIALVREKGGNLYALYDRCAHKQAPLSQGTVRGGKLYCSYHGWAYDHEGNCSPPQFYTCEAAARGVQPYPVREEYGLIFVFPGEYSLASRTPLPEIPEGRSSRYMKLKYRRFVGCHYTFMHENLMDMSHQFMHIKWMGRFRPQVTAIRSTANSVEVDYAANLDTGGWYLRTLPLIIIGPQARTESSTAQPEQLPVRSLHRRLFVTVATTYPYQSLTLWRDDIAEPILKLWAAYVPIGKNQESTRPTGLLLVRKPWIPGLLELTRPVFEFFANGVYNEDKRILELEQAAFNELGHDGNQEVVPFLLELRRLLVACGSNAQFNV